MNIRKPIGYATLEDKSIHYCAIFWIYCLNFIKSIENVLWNLGCETFSLIFDKGYDNNANMGETLELDIETFDLLLVIIDTSTWAYKKYDLYSTFIY